MRFVVIMALSTCRWFGPRASSFGDVASRRGAVQFSALAETVRSEFTPLHLRNNFHEDLLIFPGFLLLQRKRDAVVLIDIRDINLSIPDPTTSVQPSDSMGRDAKAVARKLPIAPRIDHVVDGPAQLFLDATTGFHETFDIGDRNRCRAFVEAMAHYQSTLPVKPVVITNPPSSERLPPLDLPERQELPLLPPPSRWPVTMAGVVTVAGLLGGVGYVTAARIIDELWGGTEPVLSQAPDRNTALVASPEAASESEIFIANGISAAPSPFESARLERVEESTARPRTVSPAPAPSPISPPRPTNHSAFEGLSFAVVPRNRPAPTIQPEKTLAPMAEGVATYPFTGEGEPAAGKPASVEPVPHHAASTPASSHTEEDSFATAEDGTRIYRGGSLGVVQPARTISSTENGPPRSPDTDPPADAIAMSKLEPPHAPASTTPSPQAHTGKPATGEPPFLVRRTNPRQVDIGVFGAGINSNIVPGRDAELDGEAERGLESPSEMTPSGPVAGPPSPAATAGDPEVSDIEAGSSTPTTESAGGSMAAVASIGPMSSNNSASTASDGVSGGDADRESGISGSGNSGSTKGGSSSEGVSGGALGGSI
ncbi:MAG: hypothetical protein AB7U97_24225, partial [Pirellulales bacterium]